MIGIYKYTIVPWMVWVNHLLVTSSQTRPNIFGLTRCLVHRVSRLKCLAGDERARALAQAKLEFLKGVPGGRVRLVPYAYM